ncbi:hypothetical protein [Aeoliella sp.]|uniref:hypothetical protein n=1 Tax=Aeoliella sp. TaxID=2795800 RepID=UPI003CCB79D4
MREVFIRAVGGCDDMPTAARQAAADAPSVEESLFDYSYIEFLDQQIELNARGDEWSERLRERKSGLQQWCNTPLIHGRIECGADDYSVYVDPDTQTVVWWEEYSNVR